MPKSNTHSSDVNGNGERKLVLSVSIRDCEVQTFRSGGKGGQNQNKRDTGVRVIHHPSGARGESREERSQLQNKRTAFLRMIETPQFKVWLKLATGREAVIEASVKSAMKESNILTEIKQDGKWIPAENVELL